VSPPTTTPPHRMISELVRVPASASRPAAATGRDQGKSRSRPGGVGWLDGRMLTGRLVRLRESRRDDVEAMFVLDADPEYVALASALPFQPRSLAARLAEFDKRQTESDPTSASFTVQRLDDEAGAAVGQVGLWGIDLHNRSAHVGISVLPSARGQGLGRDAVEVVCRYGFEIRALERLTLETLALNAAMNATALATGFVAEGRLRSSSWYLGRRVDEVIYGLLAHEWRAVCLAAGPDHDGLSPGGPRGG
jgi:RimJ/RimL family protein N-acetyltransferase